MGKIKELMVNFRMPRNLLGMLTGYEIEFYSSQLGISEIELMRLLNESIGRTAYKSKNKRTLEKKKKVENCKMLPRSKSKKDYETFGSVKSSFKKLCLRRGWEFEKFISVDAGIRGNDAKSNNGKMYRGAKKFYYFEVLDDGLDQKNS